ncbi:MAG: ABC transporter substrate-binding protein [Promicromonosporaceae bacterium]|nr:ABC transporter substrate-binding protein [Promicromonosporaceae bacterium]
MKIRRTAGLVAAIAATALVVSACGSPETAQEEPQATAPAGGDDTEGETPEPGAVEQHISVGWNQPFFSQNNLTAIGNATANANILYMTNWAFWYFDADLNQVPRTDFGTFEMTNEGHTLDLVLNEGVVWSDGVAVDAADLILFWGAQNPRFNTADQVEEHQTDEDGNPLFFDGEGNPTTEPTRTEEDDEGAEVEVDNTPITEMVTPEGAVWFSGTSEMIGAMNEFPEITNDGRGVTFTFTEFQNAWMSLFGVPPIAAHVVAQLALGIDDPQAAKDALIDAFRDNDTVALAEIANVWNTAFNFTSLPDNPALYLATGPFVMSEFVEGQYMILVRNPHFASWADPTYVPTVDTVTIRWNEDPLAQIQALQNFDIDLVAPQATADTLQAVQALPNASYITAVGGTWEHIDLVVGGAGFGFDSPFNPVNWNGNEDAARLVRQAFLHSIPRNQIVQTLIDPIAPGSTVRNSFLWIPGAEAYAQSVSQNGSAAFANTDVELAAELIAEARELAGDGARWADGDIPVRMIFAPANVRRQDQFQLITASAAQAGFQMVDASDPNWGTIVFENPDAYDAALFGWQSTNTMLNNARANYETDGQNNPYGWSNARIDELWEQISTMVDDDTAEARAAGLEIEQIIWDEAWTIPVFQFPEVVAYSNRVANASTIPLSPMIFWNFWEWEIVAN